MFFQTAHDFHSFRIISYLQIRNYKLFFRLFLFRIQSKQQIIFIYLIESKQVHHDTHAPKKQ